MGTAAAAAAVFGLRKPATETQAGKVPTSRNAGPPVAALPAEPAEPTALDELRMAGLAHDLNNLLGAIGNYAARALAQHRELPPNLLSDVARIADAAAGATDLARQMLRSASLPLRPTVIVELASLIAPLVATAAGGLAPAVVVHSDLDPDLLVIVDPTDLSRLVLNVLVNAIEALPGEGQVTVTAKPTIPGGQPSVRVTITDTGVGMSPEVLQRAFDPSFSTKIDNRPRGLGLTVALAVMERMGGTIELRSEPGRGTTVTMTLPRCPGTCDG